MSNGYSQFLPPIYDIETGKEIDREQFKQLSQGQGNPAAMLVGNLCSGITK